MENKTKKNTVSFQQRLKKLRKESHMTQSQLAKELNYGYTAIANYESGRNEPSLYGLIKMAEVFHVSLDYLLGVSEIRHQS